MGKSAEIKINNSDTGTTTINSQIGNEQPEKTKSAEIIEFKNNITQFELTKIIYESLIFSKIKLTSSSKLFLWALCTHYNPKNETMFPSQATVAKRLGMSAKSAERAVKELKEKNLIEYETKRVNHYKFSEKFFKLVKMSVCIGQNVGNNIRQNVELTNKIEQKKNTKNFSSFQVTEGPRKYVRYDFSKDNDRSGSRAIPSIEETQKLIKEREEAEKITFNPWDYSKSDAKKWLESINIVWMQRSELAKFLIKKYKFKKFYKTVFGSNINNLTQTEQYL